MTRPSETPDRIDDEIQFHIDQQIEKNLRAGMTREAARRDAMRRFGGIEGAREAARDEMRFAWFADFLRDLRISLRSLTRMPSYSIATILTFGLGLGAAVAMFTVVNAVLLKPLPYPQSDRLVRLFQVDKTGARNSVSGPNFDDWRTQTHSFEHMAILSNFGQIPVTGLGEPRMVATVRVSQGFLEAMNMPPAAGRVFAPSEYPPDHPNVGLISAGLAAKLVDGGPVLGRTLEYNGETITVIGVMPERFDFPAGTELWLPLHAPSVAARSRTSHGYQVVARLAPGATLASAAADISTVSRGLKTRYKDDTWMSDAEVVPMLDVMTGPARTSLQLLLAASLVLLVVACANVSNMLVARAAGRQKEFAVQLALGAGRGRVLRQLLAETAALSLCGAIVGLALASATVRLFVAMGPASAPRLGEIAVDGQSILFALGAAILIACVLALVTALSMRHSRIAPALTEEGRGASAGRRQRRLREALIVSEVTLTMILLSGGGLLARSLVNVLAISPGFSTEDALVADLTMTSQGANGLSRQVGDQSEIIARLAALPGVQQVGYINAFPIGRGAGANGQFIEMTRVDEFTSFRDVQALGPAIQPRLGFASYRLANGDYFKAMRIPLIRGRLFELGDGPDAPQVAVISESLAQQKWPDQDPIGRYIQFGNMDGDMHGIRIVGIVGDVHEVSVEKAPPAIVYVDYRQRPGQGGSFSLVVRGPESSTIRDTVRRVIHEVVPTTPVTLSSVPRELDVATGARRFNLWLIGAFGGFALLLAGVGIYALVSFTVVQRTREMGIRMALGAEPGGLVRLIAARGVALTVAGAAIGVGVSFAVVGLLRDMLFGVSGADPGVFVSVAAAMLTVAAIASALPARRILRQTPARTLREI